MARVCSREAAEALKSARSEDGDDSVEGGGKREG